MARWPGLAELKQVLDVTSEDWDDTLDRVLASAIAHVKVRIGDWDEDTDTPTEAQAQAALRMAELLSQRPESTPQAVHDRTVERLLIGSRRKFGVA